MMGGDRTVAFPAVVVGDLLDTAADDLHLELTAADCRRLATRTLELATLAGYELAKTGDDPPPCIY